MGKTDVEIFTGAGVKESQDFKREVLEKGLPAKREITFETELFGSKTFLIYVEPVFSKAGETIGVNYMGMDVTDQVNSFLLNVHFRSFTVFKRECVLIFLISPTGKKKRKDGKATRGNSSTKGEGDRAEQNNPYNRSVYCGNLSG